MYTALAARLNEKNAVIPLIIIWASNKDLEKIIGINIKPFFIH
jgi:hypothetical protein